MTLEVFFERIETQYKNALPFVAYRKPDTTLVKAVFQNDDALYTTETFAESGFVFSPFDAHEATILMPLDACEHIEIDFNTVTETKSVYKTKDVSIEARSEHINLVNKGIEAIHSNQFSKVVLSRKEIVPLKET